MSAHRFTVEQYHRMIETGLLTEDERVELLEGLIVDKMPHNPPHDGSILLAQTQLLSHLPGGWVLRIQSAITLADSEPEPDLVVAQGPSRRYVDHHPSPREIALLIEVADSTLADDRDTKGRVYARARLPVYWIVNLVDFRLEVYTRPRAGKAPAYRQRRDFGIEELVPLVIAGEEVARVPVRELLP
jgi:Uma2 family endonuclease